MKKAQQPEKVQVIPIDRITIINPRVRNRKSFKDIVENIGAIGLKKPITVARRDGPDGPRFDLVCGQGRLEAYQSLARPRFLRSSGKSTRKTACCRAWSRTAPGGGMTLPNFSQDVAGLKQRGYSEAQIADKTGLTLAYVKCVIHLIEKGRAAAVAGGRNRPASDHRCDGYCRFG